MDGEIRATTVRLKVGTLEWLKVEAVRRRVSVSEVVEQLVVHEKEKAA